jgi:hypothetical protein
VVIVLSTGKPLFTGFVKDVWLPWTPWWQRTLFIRDGSPPPEWKVKNLEVKYLTQSILPPMQIFYARVVLISPEKSLIRVYRDPDKNIAIDLSQAKFGIYDPVKKGAKSLKPITAEDFKNFEVGQIVYIEGRQPTTLYDGIRANLIMIQEK